MGFLFFLSFVKFGFLSTGFSCKYPAIFKEIILTLWIKKQEEQKKIEIEKKVKEGRKEKNVSVWSSTLFGKEKGKNTSNYLARTQERNSMGNPSLELCLNKEFASKGKKIS